MFDQFPKVRPNLANEYKRIYDQFYKQNRDGVTPATSIARRLEKWMHRMVSKNVTNFTPKSILEIGAGTLNHLIYENNYDIYDIAEPNPDLYQGSILISKIRNIYEDVKDIPDSVTYDRIISIASFEHICDLPHVVAKCGLLLDDLGQLRVGIPSEGTILWELAWRCSTGLEFKLKYGLDNKILMKYEHVNNAKEVEEILKYFFTINNYKVFGLSKRLSLYLVYTCSKPDKKRCLNYFHQYKLQNV